jgi:peptidoglycan lytic transglycosylase
MRFAGATWYGPGLYGNHTACGETLTPTIVGVAHKTLPCGTTIKLAYHGRSLVTTVIDRGPYSPGNSFDLTNGARRALGFSGADRVQYAVDIQYARHADR